MRRSQLPPPDFLNLFPSCKNLWLWGLAGSAENFRFIFWIYWISISSFHNLIYLSSTKMLLITSSFCYKVRSNFLKSYLNACISYSFSLTFLFSFTFSALSSSSSSCSFLNFISRITDSSTSLRWVGIFSYILRVNLPSGMSTVMETYPLLITRSEKEDSKNI